VARDPEQIAATLRQLARLDLVELGHQALPNQPGAWLAPAAEPTAAVPDRPHRADELDASIQQALRKLYEAVGGDPRRPGQPAG
jgi:hypothetical protein